MVCILLPANSIQEMEDREAIRHIVRDTLNVPFEFGRSYSALQQRFQSHCAGISSKAPGTPLGELGPAIRTTYKQSTCAFGVHVSPQSEPALITATTIVSAPRAASYYMEAGTEPGVYNVTQPVDVMTAALVAADSDFVGFWPY